MVSQPFDSTSPSAGETPPRSLRPSLFGSRPESALTEAEREERVQEHVRRALTGRLLAEGPLAEAGHLVALGLVGLLIWGSVPAPTLVAWAAAVTIATAVRAGLRRRATSLRLPMDAVLRTTRLSVAAVGLAWGAGAAVFMPEVPFPEAALILVIVSGLVAGATATLVADPPGFYTFLATVLTPLPIGIFVSGHDRYHFVAVAMIAVFAGVMSRLHRRSHLHLVELERTSALLVLSEVEAIRGGAYLDALFASAPTAIVALGGDGRVRGVNPRFESLFGFTAAEVVGRDLNELIAPPSEGTSAQQLDERVRRGETVVAEVTRRRKDGRLVPVRVSAARVKDGGGVDEGGIFVLYEDITAVKRAERALREQEAQYRQLVEQASDLVWQVDREARWTFLNAACEQIYGVHAEDLLGRPFQDRVEPDYVEHDRAAFTRVLQGEELSDHETVHRNVQGAPRHLSFAARPLRDATGDIVGAHGIARDVTERVAAREAVGAARDVAERAARARAAFLANMSHEIRTPMNAVLGMTELLLETPLNPEQQRQAELVHSSAEALLTILNDILDFSKIEGEYLELESIPFELPAMVDSTVRLLAVRAAQRHVELLCDVGREVPTTVQGDPGRLRQVLTNLIGNAIKFTHEGEIVVSATCNSSRDGAAVIRFAVRDTGIGIPQQKLEAIFEAFSQADVSTTRKYGGTGLGLAISRRLVQLMGGEIQVTSEPGRGSEFSFTLRMPIETVPATPEAARTRPHLEGVRTLVVDDNATNRRIVREMLSGAGITTDEAAGADAALLAMRRGRAHGVPYELVIIDAHMPGRDGFELASEIGTDADLADARLLMLTSGGQRGDAQRCRELGILGYLTKPVAHADLLEAIAAVLKDPGTAAAARGVVTRYTIEQARRHLRVLLAEDNPVNQEVAATMLRKRGHHVDVVNNGREAVEAVRRERYDIVLMDIQMPELDGLAATKAIRALPPGRELPIVALTAHASGVERERCLAAGMNGYLTKPFKSRDLFALVEGWQETPEPAAPAPEARRSDVPPVDLEEFRRTMREAGAEEAVDGILAMFLEQAPERLDALAAALTQGNGSEIAKAAHAFKSAAGTISARTLAALLQEVEAAGRSGDVADARIKFERVRGDTQKVLAHLQAVRGGAPRRD